MPPLLFPILVVLAVIVAIALWRSRAVTTIYQPNVGLLYRNGQFVRELPPGRYVRFDPFGRTKVISVSLAELPMPLAETTVLSKDQFSFRLALAPVLKILDPRLFIESQDAASQQVHPQYLQVTQGRGHAAIYTVVPAAALEVAATKTLGEMLQNQGQLVAEIQARLTDRIPGASVAQLLLTAINLPPETRKMFTDVERAKLEAQASLERARGEQASLRVLANAARLLNDNPSLSHLRLLQVIESSKGNATVVIGDGAAGLGLGKRSEEKPASAG